MMTRFAVIACSLLLIGIGNAFGQAQAPDSADERVGDKDMAVFMAIRYTGFDKMEGFSTAKNLKEARKIILSDDNTPFLHDRINSKPLWRINFENVGLPGDATGLIGPAVDYRNVEVYIDQSQGYLVKIHIPYTGDEKDYLPEPSYDWAEQQLRPKGEIFLDFVSPEDTIVTFYDILKSRRPIIYKELTAHLLRLTPRLDMEPITAWSVTFRGTEPRILKGPGAGKVPDYMKNFGRKVYDAYTAQLLYWTSIPNPDLGKRPEK